MADHSLTRLLTLPQSGAVLREAPGGGGGAILLVLPGGLCRADRYAWLSAPGCRVVVLDGALSAGRFAIPGQPAPALVELAEAMAWLAADAVPIHCVGHSAGAAAILDALDPPANPAACLPPGWTLPVLPASVTILGCTLQPQALDMVLPHRSEDGALNRPASVPLLFLAGEQDAMAPVALARKTCARFTPPTPLLVMRQATHYGWAGPREPGDNPRSDIAPDLDTSSQRERTLAYLAAMITGRLPEPVGGDRREGPGQAGSPVTPGAWSPA